MAEQLSRSQLADEIAKRIKACGEEPDSSKGGILLPWKQRAEHELTSFLNDQAANIVDALRSERAKPDDDTLAARLVEIADSNSDLYENERLWLREAAAVLESYRQGKAE
jgi:hypothetical protein